MAHMQKFKIILGGTVMRFLLSLNEVLTTPHQSAWAMTYWLLMGCAFAAVAVIGPILFILLVNSMRNY